MARRANSSKHPALAAAFSEDGEDTALAEMVSKEAWQDLTLDQKNFLGRYIMIGDGIRAAKEVGLADGWYGHQKNDVQFQTLVREVMGRPVDLARLLLAEMSPVSVQTLRDLMEQPENKDVRLRAAKIVLDAVGLTNDVSQQAPAVKVEVKMFGAQKAVVTTEGTVVEQE